MYHPNWGLKCHVCESRVAWEKTTRTAQGVAALRLYSFLAEHIDPACGAVVADQQFLADKMGVNRSTIIRWLNYLNQKTH